MDIAKELSRVRAELSEEALAKVGSVLKAIENEYKDVQADIQRVNTESKERKQEIYGLKNTIQDHEITIEDLKKKSDTSALETENANLKTRVSGLIGLQRTGMQADIEALQALNKGKTFERAKSLLKLPEADKDGKLDFSEMNEDDIAHNVSKLQEMKALGVLEGGGEGKKKSFGQETDDTPPDLEAQIKGAKTQAELQGILAEMT